MNEAKDKQTTKEKILEAAAEVFAREGFAGAKVDDIAAEAGVNKAGLYYHLGNKAQMYEQVLKRYFQNIFGNVRKDVEDEPVPERKLEVLIRSFAAQFKENPRLPRIMIREVAGGGMNLNEEILRELAGIVGLTVQVLRRGSEEGVFRDVNPGLAHMVLVGSLVFYSVSTPMRNKAEPMEKMMNIDMGRDMDDMTEYLIDLMTNSICLKQQTKDGGEA